MGDYCGELFTEEGGYFVVIGDLFVIESYWLVGGNALFLTGHLDNEAEKTSDVLCALTGLYPSPPFLSVILGYEFGYLLVKSSDYGVIGVLMSSLIPLLNEAFGYFWQIGRWLSHTPKWDVVLGCSQ